MISSIKNYFQLIKLASKIRSAEKYKVHFSRQEANKETIVKHRKTIKSWQRFIPFYPKRERAKQELAAALEERKLIEKRTAELNEFIDQNPLWAFALREVYPSRFKLLRESIHYLILTVLLTTLAIHDPSIKLIALLIFQQLIYLFGLHRFMSKFGKFKMV